MNRKLTIEYDEFEDLGIKAMSVVDEEGVVVNIFRDDEAEELFNKLVAVVDDWIVRWFNDNFYKKW